MGNEECFCLQNSRIVKAGKMTGLVGQLMAGVLSLSSLLSTSGNTPVIRQPVYLKGGNYLQVNTRLENAFDNDFEDVFKCGKPIHIWYKVTARLGGKEVFNTTCRHSVLYDPMNACWQVYHSDTKSTEVITDYSHLLDCVSALRATIGVDPRWSALQVDMEAWLSEVELSGEKRTVNLMMLWKYKRPALSNTVHLNPGG